MRWVVGIYWGIVTVTFWCGVAAGRAQSWDAVARITDIVSVNPQTIEFRLEVERVSSRWKRWANGTFQFRIAQLSPTFPITLEYIEGSTELPLDRYVLSVSNVAGERFSVMVLGPDTYGECVEVPLGDPLTIGRFRIVSPTQPLTPDFRWITPLERYQANAYKINVDTLPWFQVWDNVEMPTRYEIDLQELPRFLLADFRAVYLGDRRVRLQWRTQSEAASLGFYLVRGIRPFGSTGYEGLVFVDTIAQWRQDPRLQGQGYSTQPKVYSYVDTVDYRGEEYVYFLLWEDYNLTIQPVDTAAVFIPHSVIAFAQLNPNPTAKKTTLEYLLEDRVYLTGFISDLNGRKFMDLFVDVEKARGRYRYEIVLPPTASQGLYDVVLIAVPVDDSVERSIAVIKLQVIR